jgi:hypothetical protein
MICRIVQYHLSSVDGREARAFASSHLAGCSACLKYKEGLASLDQRLRVSSSSAPTPNFKPATITDPRTALPAFAALACAVAVILLIVKLPAQKAATDAPAQPMLAHVETAAESQPMIHVGTEPPALVKTTSSWDIPQLRRIASQAPMEQEMAALRQDGKRGIDAIMSIGRRK